jgi:hypothetical protein
LDPEDELTGRLRLPHSGGEHWLYVYLLLEFQSSIDRLTAGKRSF